MANEKRLIDAKPLMEDGWHLVKTGESNRFLASMSLADAPTVDAVEVVHAEWIFDTFCKWQCDKCHCPAPSFGYPVKEFVRTKYCPNCGAKMDGDGNG